MDYYISIIDGSMGFKVGDIHEILETDVSVSEEIYNKFFMEQSVGKQFILKDINGVTFSEIFEEVIPPPPEPEELSELEKLAKRQDITESAINDLIMASMMPPM